MLEFKTFSDIQTLLDRLGLFHMDLSLDRMESFVAAWKGRLSVVHVVGTNGKGSTATFLERIAHAHGLVTGLHTSPHFVDVRERIRLNGALISKADWVELANQLDALAGSLGLTYFEWLTCLSALAFERGGVDIAVMEAGLGGRFDATRVFAPQLTLLTPVGMDHEVVLGSTLAEIADDKSRAMRPGGMVITVPQAPEVMEVYERRAAAVGATLLLAGEVAQDRPLGLAGAHQRTNAGLALAGWEALCELTGRTSDPEACARGLATAQLPGRLQVVEDSPRLILDGAHNAHGLAALGHALKETDLRPDALLFACMRDKNVAEMVTSLLALSDGSIYLPELPDHERVLPAGELARMIGNRAVVVPTVAEALAQAGAGAKTVMLCGSLYLLAEFYKLHPHLLAPAEH
ncbi:MAG: bifunctional folylpolyglutamate synthase/dihydrofolate synthase [Proteobacteria bacterium]|nr:bifunctional folylpolyglutamate synthase/dihydrofolate synthase [Pseudomonadota bacterium]